MLTYQFQFHTALPQVADPNAIPPLTAGQDKGVDLFGAIANGYAFQQTYTVTQLTNGANPTVIAANVKVPPPNVGPTTQAVAYATYRVLLYLFGRDEAVRYLRTG